MERAPANTYSLILTSVKLLAVGIFLFVSFLYFPMTHDDAYIVARYAENFVEHSELVFNPGERISALSSPFHAFVMSFLYAFAGHDGVIVANKLLSSMLLLLSVALLLCTFRQNRFLIALILVLTIASPYVLHWTFGGLETLVLFFLITILVLLVYTSTEMNSSRLVLICAIAGLAFVTRFDSVLFLMPVVLQALIKAGQPKRVLIAVFAGAVLPTLWLAVSKLYYGDFLPTSFYAKMPSPNVDLMMTNAIYMAEFLFFSGILPFLLFVFWGLWWKRQHLSPVGYAYSIDNHLSFVIQHLRSTWGVYVGILLELGYGLTAATVHMMFSFRLLLPYLPAMILVLCDLFSKAFLTYRHAFANSTFRGSYALFCACLLAFQGYQAYYTYYIALNGLATVGEWRRGGIKELMEGGMGALDRVASLIDQHWRGLPVSQERTPRIFAGAEGIVAYNLTGAFIYGGLMSFRHNCKFDMSLASDYIFVFSRQSDDARNLLSAPNIPKVRRIFVYNAESTGARLTVFYNPNPQRNRLPPMVNEECLPES